MRSSPGKKQVHDQVICLSSREFSETSLVVVLLGRQTGRVSLLAKGARRPKSAVAIDLLDRGHATFIANPDGLGILSAFAPDRPLRRLRRDLDRYHAALYIIEIVSLSTKEFAPAEDLFDLLEQCLERADRAESRDQLAQLVAWADRTVLRWAGYWPELTRCVGCQKQMGPTESLFFSASQGGVLCRDCHTTVSDRVGLPNRAWHYLLGHVKDTVSAGMGFDILNHMWREYVGRGPRLHRHCKALFAGPAR